MTSPARMYALALALLVFFLTWAAVAARPWVSDTTSSTPDQRIAALVAQEDQLRRSAVEVQQVLDARWADYDVALAERRDAIAAAEGERAVDVRERAKTQRRLDRRATEAQAQAQAQAWVTPPQVEVVTLPPVTQTRSS